MSENLTGTGAKYAGIDRAGTAALYQEGAIQEFPGFPESLNNRFNVSLRFTPDSENAFRERVGDQIATTGNELGVGFILAGQDFTLHSTLLEGLYEGTDLAERQHKFAQILASRTVQGSLHLVGRKIEYKYLLIDKGNLLLTAIKIPEWVLTARGELADAYTSQGLKPLFITDILHISAARITSLPSEDRASILRMYGQRMAELRHQISSNPLVLEVGAISTGSPLALLRSA